MRPNSGTLGQGGKSEELTLQEVSPEHWGTYVFENSAVGIAVSEIGGRFLIANPAYQRMTGYTEAELRELTHLDLIDEADRPAARERQSRLGAGLVQVSVDKRLRRKDRSSFWARITVSPIPAMPGYALAVVEDATERKEKEELLLRSEAKYRALVDISPDVIWTLDSEGRITFMSPAAKRIYGYEPEELLGRHLLDFVPPELVDAHFRECATVLEGEGSTGCEEVFLKRDGTPVWMSCRAVPLRDDQGNVVGAMGVSTDITGQKAAAEKLRRSRDQLRALAARIQSVREEERKSLARELHDEMGQALTGLKLEFASFLRHPTSGAQERADRAQEILRLIDETIQSVGKLAANLRPGMLDDLGLVAAAEWAAREFEARTGTKCALELPPRDIAIEPETATALFRILQEALTNIARHAEATEVVVRLAGEAEDVRLEVRDNGKGFDNEQLDSARSLGLLGMAERAGLLGGGMSIESSPGKGATVTAWIPWR